MNQSSDRTESSSAALFIEQSWYTHIGIRPGHDDMSSSRDPSMTAVISQVKAAASALGYEPTISTNRQESRDHHFDGGVTTNWTEIVTVFAGTATALAALLHHLKPLLVELIKKQAGRAIRIKADQIEVELKGTDDVDRALALLARARDVSKARIITLDDD